MGELVFCLPDLGEGLLDAEIIAWHVAEGDQVVLNQPLVDVQTQKALVEIPSPVAGRVKRLHGAPGDLAKVGEPLVTFESGDEVPGVVGRVPDESRGHVRRVRLRPPGRA